MKDKQRTEVGWLKQVNEILTSCIGISTVLVSGCLLCLGAATFLLQIVGVTVDATDLIYRICLSGIVTQLPFWAIRIRYR